jgi:beta-phosphoglucomutase-like phosphatase (HAD superfamily)
MSAREPIERKVLDTVLMEFEGVLADTGPARRDALCTVLREDGIALEPTDYDAACAGLGAADAVRAATKLAGRSLDETALDLMAMRVERAFASHVGKGVVLVDGAREAVERLASRARLGIVSRASRNDISLILSLARLEHAFTCVIGADGTSAPKPSPAPYRVALRRLAQQRPVPPNGVVVALEDTLHGIRAARSAGLRTVAVGTLPAHIAMEADGYLSGLAGIGASTIQQLVVRDGEVFG